MLLIWSAVRQEKVYSALSSILQLNPNLSIEVSKEFTVLPNTSIIVALGAAPLQALQSANLVPKNRTITSLRNSPIYYNDLPVLVSYSPDIGDIDYRYFVDFLTDISLAIRYEKTGSFEVKHGEYSYVEDFSDIVKLVNSEFEETKKPVDIFTDTETVGLDPYRVPDKEHPGAYLVSIQTTHCSTGTTQVISFPSREVEEAQLKNPKVRESLEFLLTSDKVKHKGANFKYDIHWLHVRGGFECTNFVFDTTLVGSLLDENRSNSLDVHVKLYYPEGGGYSDKFDREADKSRMDLELTKNPQEFLLYSAGDTYFGGKVADAEKIKLLKDPKLTRFYLNILHPASRAFEQIEQGGMLVDIDAYNELKCDLEIEQNRLISEAKKILGGRIIAKHMDTSKRGSLNLTKASLLKDFMFTNMGLNLKPKMFTEKPDKDGNKVPSTALEHLEMFAEDENAKDFVKLISEYGSVAKTYTTYVVGFMKHIRSDGRFHPTYFLFVGNKDLGDGGAVTGRLSTVDPAFQTIPSHTKWAQRIRRCFPAPKGYLVFCSDYSQGELRVIACIANCMAMIQAYKDGKDLHTKTAASASKMLYDELASLKNTNLDLYEEIRQKGKAGNFGLAIEESMPILTDHGIFPIQEVKLHHKVWDGLEWVSHDGVISQGVYEVIEWEGVSATPNHEVWVKDGSKLPLSEAALKGLSLKVSGEETADINRVGYSSQKEDIILRTKLYGGNYYSTGFNISLSDRTKYHKLGVAIRRVRVYDILNAGPRRRFTCNGKLVSNCFGMMPPGFVNYARINYKVNFSLAEATEFRDAFFKEYWELLKYHDEYKSFAKKNRYVPSPLGRVRHLPLIKSPNREVASKEERRAINSPVQATLTDMMIWSIALHHKMGISKIAPSFGVCHDAGYNYIPEDKVDIIAPQLLEVMENLPFEKIGWNPQLKFLADAKIGPNMGDLKKYKIPKG